MTDERTGEERPDTTEFEKWLDTSDFITEPTEEQLAWARTILSHEGIRVMWGMLLATAQGKRVLLENAPLGTAQDSWRAGLIQGGIKGIYEFRSLLVELVAMGRQPAAPEEENQ